MRIEDINLAIYFLQKTYPGRLEEVKLVELIDRLVVERQKKLHKKETK